MSAQSPSLTEILTKLGDDWSIVRNRFERHRAKRYVDDDDVKQFCFAVDKGQKSIGACDPSPKTVGDLHDALGKRACEEASQPMDGPEAVLMLRRSLVPSTLPRDAQKHLLGLTLDDAKVWMKQQADGWEQEDKNRDEAFHNHPFPGVLDWVTVQTGISSDRLRKAALKHFEGCPKLVEKLGSLDQKGQTRELWERLVKESPSVLRKAGLMPEKPTDGQFSAPPAPDQVTGNAASTPPTSKTEQGEGNGGAGSAPGQEQSAPSPTRESVLRQLEPHVRKAYLAYQYAEAVNGRRLEDREAYDWLRENGIDQGKGDLGELTEYELPDSFDSFTRYCSAARKPLGENKYTRRRGRTLGRSIVPGEEIEYQRGSEE